MKGCFATPDVEQAAARLSAVPSKFHSRAIDGMAAT